MAGLNKQMLTNFAKRNKVYIRQTILEDGNLEILMKDQKIGEVRYQINPHDQFVNNDLYLMMVCNEMLSKLRVPQRESLLDVKV